jgi:hypothetical protein
LILTGARGPNSGEWNGERARIASGDRQPHDEAGTQFLVAEPSHSAGNETQSLVRLARDLLALARSNNNQLTMARASETSKPARCRPATGHCDDDRQGIWRHRAASNRPDRGIDVWLSLKAA